MRATPGTTVNLYLAVRPDSITWANGNYLGETAYRLNSIDSVLVSGSRARTYQLSYTTSANTGVSLLDMVQQFGRDATLNGSGTVTRRNRAARPADVLLS